MRIISAAEVEAALDWEALNEALRQIFRRGAVAPVRHHHEVGEGGTLLLMPAWQVGSHIGVKLATVFPDNNARDLPAVMGAYLLLDGRTGQPLALIDGPMLTLKRTAAASALASSYLSRNDSSRLLMIGTGALAPHLIMAHAAVRPIKDVLIWGRNPDKAAKLAKRLNHRNFQVEATEDREGAGTRRPYHFLRNPEPHAARGRRLADARPALGSGRRLQTGHARMRRTRRSGARGFSSIPATVRPARPATSFRRSKAAPWTWTTSPATSST